MASRKRHWKGRGRRPISAAIGWLLKLIPAPAALALAIVLICLGAAPPLYS